MLPKLTVHALALALPLSIGCGGKLVAEQPFAIADGQATISWEVPVPEGDASLWLAYELRGASENDFDHDGYDARYQLAGELSVTTSGNPVYQGKLQLSSEGSPTTQGGTTVTIGSSQSCTPSGCDISGRVRALRLEGLLAGSPLMIEASLPTQIEYTSLEALRMQLRAR